MSSGPADAATRTSPLLGELQGVGDEVAQDLRNLALVGVQHRPSPPAPRRPATRRVVGQQRPQHAAQGAEQGRRLELLRPEDHFAGLDLGQVEQVVDQLRQVLGRLADEVDLLLLLGRQVAVDAVQQDAGQRQDRVERRAELVAHVGEEARLHLRGPAEVVGLLVQLGVEGHDAAVGVVQLVVELGQLLLALRQLFQGLQQFLVLLPHLLERVLRRPAGQFLGDPRQVVGQGRGAPRQDLAEQDRGPRPRRGLDLEAVHQPPRRRRCPRPCPSATCTGRPGWLAGRRCPARGR